MCYAETNTDQYYETALPYSNLVPENHRIMELKGALQLICILSSFLYMRCYGLKRSGDPSKSVPRSQAHSQVLSSLPCLPGNGI